MTLKYSNAGTSVEVVDCANVQSIGGAKTFTTDTTSSGYLICDVAGKTLKVATGANSCKGTGATLVAGTVTVSTTAVSTGDIVLFSCTSVGGTPGFISFTISDGVSFTLTSSSGADTSTFSWLIIKAI